MCCFHQTNKQTNKCMYVRKIIMIRHSNTHRWIWWLKLIQTIWMEIWLQKEIKDVQLFPMFVLVMKWEVWFESSWMKIEWQETGQKSNHNNQLNFFSGLLGIQLSIYGCLHIHISCSITVTALSSICSMKTKLDIQYN